MSKAGERKNTFSFEKLFLFLIIIGMLVSVIKCSITCYNNYASEPDLKNTMFAYNNIISKLRYDCRYAYYAKTATNSLILYDKNTNLLCQYELKDGNLSRLDKNNNTSIIFKNIESLSFYTGKDLPNLLTVRIYPADRQEIPFFTSFALRGSENEK